MVELSTPVQYVKGIGPNVAAVLETKGIATVEDLLYYLPFRYEDRANPRRVAELQPGEMASVIAEVRGSLLMRTRKMPIFELSVTDLGAAYAPEPAGARHSGAKPALRAGAMPRHATLKCLWFHGGYLKDRFRPGQAIALYGKVEQDRRGALQIIQPQFEILSEGDDQENGAQASSSLEIGRIVPVYESAGNGKLTSRWFRHAIHRVLEQLPPDLPDALPAAIRARLNLPPRREALQKAHWPDSGESLRRLLDFRSPAQQRLIFEELFFLELGLELKRRRLRAQRGISFALTDKVRHAVKRLLPFHPTAAQKRVLKEIAADMQQPSPMRRLLQGDVGSGKTIVAMQAAAIAIENGFQVALMAPTEILATQHVFSARRILEPLAYRVVLLTGSLEQDRKRATHRHIAQGDANLVIGTHALLSERLEFSKLGLVIVDEQHRFGVLQRFRLMKKSDDEAEPDVLVMTATPIPRTLALTLYGDLDVSILDELPPGRTPVVTRHVDDERAGEVWAFLRKQVSAGRQAYVVYPVIEGSDEEGQIDFAAAEAKKSTLKAAEQMHRKLKSEILPGVRVGLLHGRLNSEDKEIIMRRFARGEIDVLVSTTVVEVGVDVPNANLMIIEHADRFGLSQLHQLRGRIGRGSAKSFCVLMTTGEITEDAQKRLAAMVRTSNGFEIAELDLEQRGPGEFFGTKQAGMPSFRVANLLRDRDLLEAARREAQAALAGMDTAAPSADFSRTLVHLKAHWQRRYGLVEVG
ncbi:MAG TPA: ATP-dependent DNA helicase RecG [Terriglobales bacterium]|nr:ATP-dependent DNA helicase RecG [Terriglobales bacterium]